MRFRFEGEDLSISRLMLSEMEAVQDATDLTWMQLQERASLGDARALRALVWLARRQRGETTLRYEDVDGDVLTFAPADDEGIAPGPGKADVPSTSGPSPEAA